jgi:hypothetical protein
MRCLTAYAEPFGDLALEEAEAERLSEPVESVLRQAVTRVIATPRSTGDIRPAA